MPDLHDVVGPRHRRYPPPIRPRWQLTVAAAVCGVVLLALCVGVGSWYQRGSGTAQPEAPNPHAGGWYDVSAPVSPGRAAASAQPSPVAGPGSGSATEPAGPGSPGGTGGDQGGGPGGGPPAGRTSAPPPNQARPPGGPPSPLLTVTQHGGPSTVDLSAEGTVDWVHWGLRTPSTINRKRDGANAITDQGGVGPRERADTSPRRYSWHDGGPDRAVTNTTTGVYGCGLSSGFKLAVAAGPQIRTLRLHGGVWRATGRLDVSLAGTGLTGQAQLSDNANISLAQTFTITFRAPTATTLQLRWHVTEFFNVYCGAVNLQAATLS